MKKFILIAALAIIAAFSSQAQLVDGQQSLSVPSVVFAGTTNLASPFTIDCRKQGRVTLELVTTSSGISGCTNQYIFCPSITGIYYDFNNTITCSNSVTGSSGTITTNTVTITVPGSVRYLKCFSMVTTGTSSNNIAYYGIKGGTPY